MENPNWRTLSQLVRAERQRMGLTQEQFGKTAKRHPSDGGLSASVVSQIECDTCTSWRDKTLERLSTATNRDIAELRKLVPVRNSAVPKTTLGLFILKQRRERGLSRGEVALMMGKSWDYVRSLETGRVESLRLSDARLLGEILWCDPKRLISLSRPESRMQPCVTPLGQYVRKRRLQLELSQSALALLLRKSKSYVSAVELNNHINLSQTPKSGLEAWAKALKVSLIAFKTLVPPCPPRFLARKQEKKTT